MSVLTDWFEGRKVEEEHERAYWGRIVLEISCAVLAGVLLSGCASTKEETQVCYMQFLGKTGSGLSVVREMCVSEEQFAESQK